MKKHLFIICFLGLSSFCQAQTDVHLNIVNLLFFEASGSIEKGLNKNISVGGFAGYFYGLPHGAEGPFFLSNNGGENKYFHIGPEVKFYVYPDGSLNRFFVGAYARYTNGKATSPDNYGGEISSRYNKGSMGLSLGSKWVTKSNIIFGFFGGIDRNFVSNYNNERYLGTSPADGDDEYFGYRIGAHIGYRFGNKSTDK
ncbi:hypothetical protein [Reichenbachiella ulvae]|uniref:Outer membrane protein beta-barrel domain-containing protein n=1 Tax=Reichenbachiella ulvae TaxID=2980104 RepID=A0ABT3CQ59_9BACT|nr:hypothetical protein [Reichenbachiella ulvae]MCV9385688.1 hypothetical protein [Reichenbachiella ulvae]